MSLAVFDIDGVLADVRHRLRFVTARPKDWIGFFRAAPLDPPLPDGVRAVMSAERAGHRIVYLTGRPEWCRSDTESWLAQHGLPYGPLYMRENRDRRPARVTKVAQLRQLSREHRIEAFVDDDVAVVEAVRTAGFRVIHARWMGTETDGADAAPGEAAEGSHRTAQEVLFEIQEQDPHT
jgi:phosphoglycolate phosphatase-like HAD superfamily hydrolase